MLFLFFTAVVGGGIGGTSNAFYLKDLFGENAAITLFEKDAIGGRLATVSIAGAEYEIGGTILHPRNLYMKKFVQDFGETLSIHLMTLQIVGLYGQVYLRMTEFQPMFIQGRHRVKRFEN